jgi:hypothetical protein
MLHEQDPSKGGCPFRRFFEQTPEELQKKYRLFDTLAVPLYPSPEHRAISLRYALRNMGATEQGARYKFWRRLWYGLCSMGSTVEQVGREEFLRWLVSLLPCHIRSRISPPAFDEPNAVAPIECQEIIISECAAGAIPTEHSGGHSLSRSDDEARVLVEACIRQALVLAGQDTLQSEGLQSNLALEDKSCIYTDAPIILDVQVFEGFDELTCRRCEYPM